MIRDAHFHSPVGDPSTAIDQTLRVASGWLELGLADQALGELKAIPDEARTKRDVLELKLHAEMSCKWWNPAAETARLLCLRASHEPVFFLQAAACLHQTGDTHEACNWLMRGPRALHGMAAFHFDFACYLWTLEKGRSARYHLHRAISMDGSLRKKAMEHRDLAGIGPVA